LQNLPKSSSSSVEHRPERICIQFFFLIHLKITVLLIDFFLSFQFRSKE